MSDGGEVKSGGLWGGRFSKGLSPEMEPLNRSLGVDGRLWLEDVQGSRAWARALEAAGVLTDEERASIVSGLDTIETKLAEEGIPAGAADEDIHTLVERMLREEVGAAAGKLHTGRSRNDQVATDVRLWAMRAADELSGLLTTLGHALASLAEGSVDLVIPGYTHLQPGQPIRAAHWALSHAWPLLRDRERIRRARATAAVLPLGSGALAGCPFPVDRQALCDELGFDRVSENSLDAVSDRDWSAELVFAGALLGVHLSRLGEDLVLFSSREFGLTRIGEGFATGSSLMPQKRNPDVAELARGKAGRLQGSLSGLLTLLKGLPTGYNRDLQEEKAFVFDTVDSLLVVLPALTGAVRSIEFQPEAASRLLSPEMFATDIADVLVRAGVPFRESHEIVGQLVKEAEERGVSLSDLPSEVFRGAHASLEDVSSIFDWERSVEARDVAGGTSRRAVAEQLAEVRRQLGA